MQRLEWRVESLNCDGEVKEGKMIIGKRVWTEEGRKEELFAEGMEGDKHNWTERGTDRKRGKEERRERETDAKGDHNEETANSAQQDEMAAKIKMLLQFLYLSLPPRVSWSCCAASCLVFVIVPLISLPTLLISPSTTSTSIIPSSSSQPLHCLRTNHAGLL